MTARALSPTSPRALAAKVAAASAVPVAAIGWMLVSGAAGWAACVVLGLLTASVNAALWLRATRGPEQELQEQEPLFRRSGRRENAQEDDDHDADWAWSTDTLKQLMAVSPRLAHAFGRSVADLEGMPLLPLLAGETWESGDVAPALHTLADHLKRRQPFAELVLPVTVAGELRWWELAGAPRADASGEFAGFRGTGADVTAERLAADKINRMARFDPLTGLPNRLHLTESLTDALIEAEHWRNRCAFLITDLDRFKGVNDTLGHALGDRLLVQVAERLSALLGPNQLCGRLGGDEFGIVLGDAGEPAAIERLATRIVEALSAPYLIDSHHLYVGASVGIAIGPRDGKTAETLIRSADLALYRAKDTGGGVHAVYEPQLHVDAEERRLLEIALRRALANEELTLAYQPVVDAQSGTIEGFEALLRWTHPQLGSVSPVKFIPVAEQARLIGPIGEWALRTACHEAAHWPSTVRVAVNVSAEQLHSRSFVQSVAAALQSSGLPPHRLELEVTESVFMGHAPTAVAVLRDVLAMGVRLSLDDFGTGYSSLGYLSRTRFSTIKIDRSFVVGAAQGTAESLAIIRAVVALADSLGMTTTAEGVETEEELATVRRLGCRKIQGYLFGRPMPARDARALFGRGNNTAAA